MPTHPATGQSGSGPHSRDKCVSNRARKDLLIGCEQPHCSRQQLPSVRHVMTQSPSALQASASVASRASLCGTRRSEPRGALVTPGVVSRGSGGPPVLTDDVLLHAEKGTKRARVMINARAHCEHVDNVILMQCFEHVCLVIGPRVYRASALPEEIVNSTRQRQRMRPVLPAVLAV